MSLYANHFNTDGDNVSRTGGEDDGYRNTTAGFGVNWQATANNAFMAGARMVDYRNDYDATDFRDMKLPSVNNPEVDEVYHGMHNDMCHY